MPVSQKVQIDTYDFGASLTAPTLGALATGTTISNGTASTCDEQTADSGVYIADFIGADESALIPAGTYRLRTVINGLPLKRFVTFAGVDGEIVYAREEEHTVLDSSTQQQIVNSVLTTALTESYATDGVSPTLTQAILLVLQHMSESSVSGVTKTVKKLDGSTTAATFTLNSATTPTAITRSA